MDKHVLRIAITDIGGARWTGGITYRKNLLEALRQYSPDTIIYLVTEQLPELAVESENFKIVRYSSANSRLPALIGKITIRLLGYDFLLHTALKSIPGGVDIVFPGRYTMGKRIALLFWIPDFQFLHLPGMYTKPQIRSIESKFRLGVKNATLVMLSSRDAYRDYRQFVPEYADKGRVLNFVAHIPAHLYDVDPMAVVHEYHLPEKFFYLPNQFWKHKNHQVVFKALRILKKRGVKPFFVFTGNPLDARHPMYFAEIMHTISQWGLRNQVAFLGLIPHDHVYSLIRQSICVVNPSLFEGWSTTVEEVKSVGKRMLLSSLGVHREQNPPGGIYFDPHDPKDLADKLAEIWAEASPGPDLLMEQQARVAQPERMQQFADSFISIAQEAVTIAGTGLIRKIGT